ncbi:MAG: glutathione S-transferase C-terminal domain-containing protein [Cyanobacteria bacterium J06621_11]
MGQMIAGQWFADDDIGAKHKGAFEREPSLLRNVVSTDASATFPAESGRYHLYVAWNCPWAHRTVLMRALKGLKNHVGMSIAAPRRTAQGWVFNTQEGYKDNLFDAKAMHEIYARGAKNYTGRVTVPVLYDTKTDCIVNNESADIVRMLNGAFGDLANDVDLYPEELRDQIDDWNERIYNGLNNGVYRAGFAETQSAYDASVENVFETLDAIEAQLVRTRYLTGNRLTEADVRLFPTLVRFDVGYYSAFKCNRNRLIDFPNLWRYARDIYHMPDIKETVFFDIYRRGYSSPSPKRNIYGIAPIAPDIHWDINAGQS